MFDRGKTWKNATVGIATVLPIPIWTVTFFAAFGRDTDSESVPAWVPWAMLAWAVITFGTLVLLVFDAMRNDRLSDSQRTQWILILIFLAVFTMPIYFWQYRWRAVVNSAGRRPHRRD